MSGKGQRSCRTVCGVAQFLRSVDHCHPTARFVDRPHHTLAGHRFDKVPPTIQVEFRNWNIGLSQGSDIWHRQPHSGLSIEIGLSRTPFKASGAGIDIPVQGRVWRWAYRGPLSRLRGWYRQPFRAGFEADTLTSFNSSRLASATLSGPSSKMAFEADSLTSFKAMETSRVSGGFTTGELEDGR